MRRPTPFIALGALAVLNTADVITTNLALANGGVEGNPAMVSVVPNLGLMIVVKLVFMILFAVVMCIATKKIPNIVHAMCWFLVGVYSLTIATNIHLLGLS